MRQPTEHYNQINSARLCWFEWGVPNSEPTIVLIHATGFHARCWDQVIAQLGDRHILALDLRNHGRSENGEPCGWEVYSSDVMAFIESQNLYNIVLVGHSMGGYCAANALCEIGHRVKFAVLVDPVIMNPETYSDTHERHESFLNDDNEHPVSRRRNHFVDADAMYKNFEGRGSYASWKSEALHDYCDYGLQLDEANGGYKLACPPHLEASIYMGSMSQPIFDSFGKVSVPITIMRAKRVEVRTTLDFTLSPTWPDLADQFINGRDVYLPELTHFMPMQAPDLVAEYILGRR